MYWVYHSMFRIRVPPRSDSGLMRLFLAICSSNLEGTNIVLYEIWNAKSKDFPVKLKHRSSHECSLESGPDIFDQFFQKLDASAIKCQYQFTISAKAPEELQERCRSDGDPKSARPSRAGLQSEWNNSANNQNRQITILGSAADRLWWMLWNRKQNQ